MFPAVSYGQYSWNSARRLNYATWGYRGSATVRHHVSIIRFMSMFWLAACWVNEMFHHAVVGFHVCNIRIACNPSGQWRGHDGSLSGTFAVGTGRTLFVERAGWNYIPGRGDCCRPGAALSVRFSGSLLGSGQMTWPARRPRACVLIPWRACPPPLCCICLMMNLPLVSPIARCWLTAVMPSRALNWFRFAFNASNSPIPPPRLPPPDIGGEYATLGGAVHMCMRGFITVSIIRQCVNNNNNNNNDFITTSNMGGPRIWTKFSGSIDFWQRTKPLHSYMRAAATKYNAFFPKFIYIPGRVAQHWLTSPWNFHGIRRSRPVLLPAFQMALMFIFGHWKSQNTRIWPNS